MYRITGKIQGVAPVLFSRFYNPESTEQPGGGRFTIDERKAEALLRVHRRPDGEIVIPKNMFKNCLLEGVKKAGLKEGRGSLMPYIEATVFVEQDLPLGKTEPDSILETWGRRPPKTGGACMVRYPAFETGWEAPFTLVVVDDRRNSQSIKRALDEGGLLVGIGSWRPEYGRFIVTEWRAER